MESKLEEKVILKTNNAEDFQSIHGPAYDVAEKLREKGYDIAGHGDIRVKYPILDFIGILKDRKPLEKSFLGIIKYKKSQKALHIGTIWFNNNKRKANENQKWILEVNGKRYLPSLTKLVDYLSKPYDVKVEVTLKSESPKEENYILDII